MSCRGAQRGEAAHSALRRPGAADPTTVKDQSEADVAPLVRRPQRTECRLHLHRVVEVGEPEAPAEAAHVGVDRQPRQAECHAAHDVAGLPPDAGQRHELDEFLGHLTGEPLAQGLRHGYQVACLALEEARGADDLLDLVEVGDRQRRCVGIAGEQGGGHQVHPGVGALRGEDRGGEQFEGRPVVEFAHGFRVLDDEFLVAAHDKDGVLHRAAETVLKGPEMPVPIAYLDKGGHRRDEARVRWWDRSATTMRSLAEIASSFTTEDKRPYPELPDTPYPEAEQFRYDGEVPVVFGHYWRRWGEPLVQPTAACVDLSVAGEGHLAAYRWDGEPTLDEKNIEMVGAALRH